MMKTKTLLAAAILSMVALAGYSQAQTPSPTPVPSPTPNPYAGTYNDKTLSAPQRIQLADAVLASGTDSISVGTAASFMLTARPVINLLNAFPNFAASIIADPTLSGTINDPGAIGALYMRAIEWKTDATPALNDKVTYLQPLLTSTLFNLGQANELKVKYAGLVAQQAQLQFNTGNYAGAITTVAPVLGWNGAQAVGLTFSAKVALRSSDVLSWAKLVYELQDFQHTQAGIDAVSSAYRALDTNLVRANAFIQYQKDGVGTNPIAAVTLPQVSFLGTSAWVNAANYTVTGDSLDALKTAVNAFAIAPSGASLNNATAFVASQLRNIDGNLVRANAFVTAQSQGQSFTIPELSGSGASTSQGYNLPPFRVESWREGDRIVTTMAGIAP
jgi:hypothetical protein